jgi:hypothetical protein
MQAFGKLTGICTGYGGTYNPGQQNLQVNAMITLLNSAQQAMDEVNEAQVFYDNATNNRELGFKGLRKISSSVCTLLKSSGANELTINDACASNRRIWGARAAKRKAAKPEGEVQKQSFSYGQDYASLANHFAKLVETVSAEPKYRPNERGLSVAGLQQKLTELQNLNNTVAQAEIRLTQARRSRNELYYQKEGNLFSTALAVKQYVRGVFGYQSSQHLEVQRIHFTKPNM